MTAHIAYLSTLHVTDIDSLILVQWDGLPERQKGGRIGGGGEGGRGEVKEEERGMSPECRCASEWFMIACLRMFIGNTTRNPLVQIKETENKRDLLAREVVGAQISFYWAHGWLEVPEIKCVLVT